MEMVRRRAEICVTACASGGSANFSLDALLAWRDNTPAMLVAARGLRGSNPLNRLGSRDLFATARHMNA